MRGAAAIAPVGAPKKGHVSVLEDGREAGTGLLGWASSRVTGDCGEGKVGLVLVRSLTEGEDGVITEQFASSLFLIQEHWLLPEHIVALNIS